MRLPLSSDAAASVRAPARNLAAPPPDLEPYSRYTAMTDAATGAAIMALAASVTVWARQLIDSIRGPCAPDVHAFPALGKRPLVFPPDVDALPSRSDFRFSDDENDAEVNSSSDEDWTLLSLSPGTHGSPLIHLPVLCWELWHSMAFLKKFIQENTSLLISRHGDKGV
jgi:hypothetical protein